MRIIAAKFGRITYALFVLGFWSCGTLVGNPEEEDDKKTQQPDQTPAGQDVALEAERPTDSTGATGRIGLSLAAAGGGAALGLADELTISYAKFGVAKVKLKATRVVSVKETEIARQENDAEKSAVMELDLVAGSPTLALANPDSDGNKPKGQKLDPKPEIPGKPGDGSEPAGKAHKDRKAERKAKLAEKKAELHDKAKAQLDKEAKGDQATKFVGPFIYDALLGKIEGALPAAETTDGSYQRVEFQLRRDFAVGVDDPLFGNVFAIQGTVMRDGAPVPFAVEWNIALNFRLFGDGAFAVAPGADNTLSIGFDVHSWFAGIDWASATVDADGTIYVDRSANREIMRQVHRNMKSSTVFGRDQDGDGKLGATESAGKGQETLDVEVP